MNTKIETMTKEQCALVTSKKVNDFIRREANRYGVKHPSIGKDEFYSIGIETACLIARSFNAEEGRNFLDFIAKYVIFKMRQRISRDVYGMHQENNEVAFTKMVMIEEDLHLSNEERLSTLIENMDDDRKDKWDILEPLLDRLTAEEREMVMTRFGFFDNNGEAIREYMEKHKMSKTAFYRRSNAIVQKLRDFAQENN